MKCKDARRLSLMEMLDPPEGAADPALAEHLVACPGCRLTLPQYGAVVRAVRGMEPVEPPEELRELVSTGISEGIAHAADLPRPPAVPDPERSSRQKAVIVVGAVTALAGVTVALMALFGRSAEPLPSMGTVVMADGKVEMSTPGESKWRDLHVSDFLVPGTRLRTSPDSYLQVRGDGVEWWVSGMSSIALTGEARAELLAGRVYVKASRPEGRPAGLLTANGGVDLVEGELTAFVTMKRLRLACLSGTAQVAGEDAPLLTAGQAAMLVEGAVSGPVRAASIAHLTHWLHEFPVYDDRHLQPRQLATVPVAAAEPHMPDTVVIDALEVEATVRGPLVVLRVTATLSNGGDEPWQGAPGLADGMLPPPLAVDAAEPLRLEPGQSGTVTSRALCLMRNRQGYYAVGLNPEAWTRQAIGRVELSGDVAADGGMREVLCPTLGWQVDGEEDGKWLAAAADVGPGTPIVLEVRPKSAGGVDALLLSGDAADAVLLAWRPDPDDAPWLVKEQNVFIAVDGTADYGPAGRTGLQDVLEGLMGFLPPGCVTALIGYDGKIKPDPDKLMRHFPARVESLLERLWHLPEGKGDVAAFVRDTLALVSGAEGEGLVVFVTGRHAEGAIGELPDVPGNLKAAVVQVGVDRVDAGLRAWAASTGGVALALPLEASSELAVVDFLAHLRVPALAGAALEADASAGLAGRAGQFANQPVLFLLDPATLGADLRGALRADAGGEEVAREFEIRVPRAPAASGALADRALQALR